MSKRGGDPTCIRTSKIKKRRGVGSRTITVIDSDEDQIVSKDYARATKTRVAASGRMEGVSISTVPIFEVEQSSTPVSLEENVVDLVDVVKDSAPAVPAKQVKRVNDSVSDPHRPFHY